MLNLGSAPDVRRRQRELEAHLFEAEGDFYGMCVRIDFVRRLRDTVRFAVRRSAFGAAPPRRRRGATSAGQGTVVIPRLTLPATF